MFDEDNLKPKADSFIPLNLERLSVQELNEYIQDLKDEIQRVEGDIQSKQASRSAAEDVFK